MFNGVNILVEIPGENPNSFGRNLFKKMFDGRYDMLITDDGAVEFSKDSGSTH